MTRSFSVALAAGLVVPCLAVGQTIVPPLQFRIAAGDFCPAGDEQACQTRKFGRNDDVDTGAYELVSLTGEDHQVRFDDTTFSLASESVEDTDGGSAGVGAVTVSCFTEDYELIEETVTLNGRTPVAMVTPCAFPVRMKAADPAVPGGSNDGIIWIGLEPWSTGEPDWKYGQIGILDGEPAGQTLILGTAVRAGFTACMTNLHISTRGDVEVLVRVFAQPGPVARLIESYPVADTSVKPFPPTPICVPEKTRVMVYAKSRAGGADDVGGSFTWIEFKTNPTSGILSGLQIR